MSTPRRRRAAPVRRPPRPATRRRRPQPRRQPQPRPRAARAGLRRQYGELWREQAALSGVTATGGRAARHRSKPAKSPAGLFAPLLSRFVLHRRRRSSRRPADKPKVHLHRFPRMRAVRPRPTRRRPLAGRNTDLGQHLLPSLRDRRSGHRPVPWRPSAREPHLNPLFCAVPTGDVLRKASTSGAGSRLITA